MRHHALVCLLVVGSAPFGALACRGIAGIKDIELADGGPTGTDGNVPPGPCPSTAATILFSSPDGFDHLSVLDGFIYADLQTTTSSTTNGGGGVVRCPAAGCTTPQIAQTVVGPSDLNHNWAGSSVTASGIYSALSGILGTNVNDGGNVTANNGTLNAAGLDGTNARTFAPNLAYPGFPAATATDLFWTNDPTGAGDTGVTSLMKCSLATGCSAGSGGNPPGSVWLSGVGTAYGVSVDSANVYLLAAATPNDTSGAAQLYSCPLATSCGAPHVVVSGLSTTVAGTTTVVDTSFYTSDGTYVYVAPPGQTSVLRVSVAAGSTTMIATGQQGASGLVLDGSYLYWGTSTGTIYRASKNGTGALQAVACQLASPSYLAVDASSIYFVGAGAGGNPAVYKLPKPQP